jgi:hypothetical protein
MAAAAADQPEAEVVADDRRRGRNGDDDRDRVVPLRREDAKGDQRRLSRNRDPERLDRDGGEQKRQSVVCQERRHGAPPQRLISTIQT